MKKESFIEYASTAIKKFDKKFLTGLTVKQLQGLTSIFEKYHEQQLFLSKFSDSRALSAFEKYKEAGFDTIWMCGRIYWVAGYFCQSKESIGKWKDGLFFDGIVTYMPTDNLSWAEREDKKSPRADNPIEAIEMAYDLWKQWKEGNPDWYSAYKLSRHQYVG